MPDPSSTTHREVRVVGRPYSGATDPVTGEIANGGLCFYDSGTEHRVDPGDVVRMPNAVAAAYLADGLVVDPSAPLPTAAPAPAPDPEPVADGDDDDDDLVIEFDDFDEDN